MDFNYKGVNIHFTFSGKGSTVVFLHGFTESLEIWDFFSKGISKHFSVLCIDLPGHGKSGCIGEVHTMELMADVVKSVLESLHISKCVIIGHSMGGYVALAFADKFSHVLNGLGLFHSSAAADSEEAKINRSRAIEIIKNNHQSFLTSFIPDLFTAENREIYKNDIESLINTAKQMSKEAVIAAQEGMKVRLMRYHVLENAKIPVLFIAGHKDTRIPISKVLEQIILPEYAHVLLLRNSAHMGYIEAREETFQFTLSFLTQIILK